MSLQPGDIASGFVARGQLNRAVGWTLLATGLALAAWLDPWFFASHSAEEFAGSMRPAVRHAQGVVIGMAMLQLAMAHLLATSAFPRKASQAAALLTAVGAGTYTAGYAAGLTWPAFHWLVLGGSLLSFSGFAYLLWVQPSRDYAYAPQVRMILPIVCFGMLLDLLAGLLTLLPEPFVLDHLGADDEVRLRMMRLARVAVIALSALTLLYYGVARRAEADRDTAAWGGLILACGAIGMPAILAAACFTTLHWKYLLALPATAVLIGVSLGLWFAWRHASWLEWWGWALIVASTSVGMLIGLYAFDGPLPAPRLFDDYNAPARRLARLAHSYSIVLGMTAIFLARELESRRDRGWFARLGAGLFVAGSIVTVGVSAAQILAGISTTALSVGPALAASGVVACLASCIRPRRHGGPT